MKIRQRTKNLLFAGGIGALVVAVIAVILILFLYSSWKKDETEKIQRYQNEISELQKWATDQVTGYVLKEDTEAGTKITEDMLEQVLLPPQSAANDVLDIGQAAGRTAKVDMKSGMVMTASILAEQALTPNDLREAEYNFMLLPSKIKKDDYVDVRIQFPNGNDYVLFSKKKVSNVEGTNVWLEMDEEEILTMSSAMVDAYYENAVIYSLAYVEPELQRASVVTYPVKQNVLDLILESPNVVDIAREELKARGRNVLESGLQKLTEEQRLKFQDISNKKQVENGNKAPKESEEKEDTDNQEPEDVFTESIDGE
ncbi:SAF domain-containing protein [Cytobacillus purgationiresistens]|uniref:SAF domain-containing protein n=1 Tax=Cytobacillus purgationiresistens TaxID=863449 RepID=A0ABU0AIX8_9BACI|nr:SAF domain-containing protein [Cytobacillus purgationiresistens]MDQ0271211.1 hypothetical protein [Cytobacillus purgationiresistens]